MNNFNDQTYKAIEYSNALETFKLKPANIEKLCKIALKQDRFIFLDYIIELYLGARGLTEKQEKNINLFIEEMKKKKSKVTKNAKLG